MYNRQKAVEYARTWALGRNPRFYSFDRIGGDCTNFISQCVFAGGVSMLEKSNGWFFKSLNYRSPSWTGVEEFWNFATSNNFEKGVKVREVSKSSLQIGDIVQLGDESGFYHMLLISEIKNGNILVCAHDFDSLDRNLSSYYSKFKRFGKIIN